MSPGTTHKNARVAQLVEHHLAKVGVAGSSPVSRSFNIKNEVIQMGDLIFCIKEHFTSRRDDLSRLAKPRRDASLIPSRAFLINEAHTGLEGSRSRLPARSVLLLRRGVHWTPAPRLAQMSVMSPYSRRARGTQGVQLWYGCCFRCTVSPFIS